MPGTSRYSFIYFSGMKRLGLLLLLLSVLAGAKAQDIITSLERDAVGQGKVTIHQDVAVQALMSAGTTSEQSVIKTSGFRIQVYAGNNTRDARNEANEVASRVKKYFPDLKVYTLFNPPRRLCRVGDFRSFEEADAVMRRMKSSGAFKEISIVKDQINISL